MSYEEPTSPTARNRGVAMLPRLAIFLHANGRRVLIGAVICAVLAGVFGAVARQILHARLAEAFAAGLQFGVEPH